jgi:hypothetical protein
MCWALPSRFRLVALPNSKRNGVGGRDALGRAVSQPPLILI